MECYSSWQSKENLERVGLRATEFTVQELYNPKHGPKECGVLQVTFAGSSGLHNFDLLML